MTFSEVSAAFEAVCNNLINSEPTLENVNIALDLLEVLRDTPEHFANCLSAVAVGDKQQIIEKIFLANHFHITDLILSDPRLTLEDASLIIEGLARQLPLYNGNTTELGFRAWLNATTKPSIEFYGLKRQYANAVRKGIWSILGKCADLGIDFSTFRDIEAQTWVKAFLKLDQLLLPGTANMKNRLYSLGQFQARAWRTQRLRNRAKFTSLDEYRKIENGLSQPRRVVKSSDDLKFKPEPEDTGDDGTDYVSTSQSDADKLSLE
jgi:hypothetical protein